jgi:hypothetical protein
MPIIRGEARVRTMPNERRQALVAQLGRELAGTPTEDPPVIFEIPLAGLEKFDVLVLWPRWHEVDADTRTALILEASGNRRDEIAQALGVTYDEAMEQQLLPYAVVPMIRQGEVDQAELRALMLAVGGIALPNGRVDLRFPTPGMAETAHRYLCQRLPQGYWSIVQHVGP